MTEKKTSFIMTSTVIASIINVALSIFSANKFGVQGVVVTLMFSFIILLLLRLWSMIKQQGVHLGKGFIFSLFSLLISVVLFYWISNPFLLTIPLIVLLIFALIDMRAILQMLMKKWKQEK